MEQVKAGPLCEIGGCGPATCHGMYDDDTDPWFACDYCCGHSQEGGTCVPVEVGSTRVGHTGHHEGGYLLNSYRTDCEHAKLCRRKSMPSKADAILERARNRTTGELARKWGFMRVARHAALISRVYARTEARVFAPQNDLFGGARG